MTDRKRDVFWWICFIAIATSTIFWDRNNFFWGAVALIATVLIFVVLKPWKARVEMDNHECDCNGRRRIYDEIDGERYTQDKKWGHEFDDKKSPYDWMGYIIKYATGENKLPKTTRQFRKQMIQTAALAIAAIEAIDRGACKMHPDNEAIDGYSLVALLGYEAGQGIQWPFDRHRFMSAVGGCSYVCKHILDLYHKAHDFTPKHLDVPPAKGD
jgi:hypothetical protein